jgi:hypothetical protein
MPTMKTLEMYDAELAALDMLIAKSQAIIDARDSQICYRLDSRPFAFALPIAHVNPDAKVCVWNSSDAGWEHLGAYVLTSAAILPGDSRWSKGGVR